MLADEGHGLLVPEIHLFHSKKRCRRYLLRHTDIRPKFVDGVAQMFYDSGKVAVFLPRAHDVEAEMSLLAHEAYHAACAHMRWLGEDEAGEETMAYYVQTICDALFRAHAKWRMK